MNKTANNVSSGAGGTTGALDMEKAAENLRGLLAVMARLRDPNGGCPWDLEQDFASIAPYTLEEAFEVADAIQRDDLDDLRDELGDLLLQVVFHARMAEEDGSFDFADVAAAITDKMIRRHPHVFADAMHRDAEEQTRAWEDIKAAERAAKGRAAGGDPRRKAPETRRPGRLRLACSRSGLSQGRRGAC